MAHEAHGTQTANAQLRAHTPTFYTHAHKHTRASNVQTHVLVLSILCGVIDFHTCATRRCLHVCWGFTAHERSQCVSLKNWITQCQVIFSSVAKISQKGREYTHFVFVLFYLRFETGGELNFNFSRMLKGLRRFRWCLKMYVGTVVILNCKINDGKHNQNWYNKNKH